ncbi:tryptophan synthase beta subunit-like PLP-dependent enzyme [Xylariaceae sp. FL0255]|nr:tryptophan synthase beta subunit-like PLP-dependent enzyme [Xylariaceae sp. FL0255]
MGSHIEETPAPPALWTETPCVFSMELSRIAGCNIYLKLENIQPSGSFKSRGIGNYMARNLSGYKGTETRFYCSSGGNAGLACAAAAKTLGLPAEIFLTSKTPQFVVEKLNRWGSMTHRGGNSWPEADKACRAAAAAAAENGVYVPPFDHPDIWAGNSTMVDELKALEDAGFFPAAMGSENEGSQSAGGKRKRGESGGEAGRGGRGKGKIDAIVCNVGGGGLINGIMEGIERNYGPFTTSSSPSSSAEPTKPLVLALETEGCDSLAESIKSNSHATLPAITSIAITLGAPRVSSKTYEWSKTCKAMTTYYPFIPSSPRPPPVPGLPSPDDWSPVGHVKPHMKTVETYIEETGTTLTGVVPDPSPRRDCSMFSVVVPDATAVKAVTSFLDDERMLVEPSCGAMLAAVYDGNGRIIRDALRGGFGNGGHGRGLDADVKEDVKNDLAQKNVVLIVCGGCCISLDMLAEFRARFGV